MNALFANMHSIIPSSEVNGPGKRLVVFFQGCPFNCRGCFNPETHAFVTRDLVEPADILKEYLGKEPGVEGITVSGGEPFMQAQALAELLRLSKEVYGLSTLVYTGFTIEELRQRLDCNSALAFIDVLVDGRYVDDKKEETLIARGSTNQRFIFLTGRYTEADLVMPGKVEVVIKADGTIVATGFSNQAIQL